MSQVHLLTGLAGLGASSPHFFWLAKPTPLELAGAWPFEKMVKCMVVEEGRCASGSV